MFFIAVLAFIATLALAGGVAALNLYFWRNVPKEFSTGTFWAIGAAVAYLFTGIILGGPITFISYLKAKDAENEQKRSQNVSQ